MKLLRTLAVSTLFLLLTAVGYAKPDRENLKFLYELYKDTGDLQFNSQFEQDRFVYTKFFKNKRNGVFVDIGAHDGMTISNTYFFEKTMGWTGICVEPIPEVFQKLEQTRSATCIQGCIYDSKEEAQFLRFKGYPEMLSGLMDTNQRRQEEALESVQNGSAEIITVKCYNLNQLLLDQGIHHVDYLSVDTEGGEVNILKSIDYDKIIVDVIDVENNDGDALFEKFLSSKGYKKIATLGPDEIYYRMSAFPHL